MSLHDKPTIKYVNNMIITVDTITVPLNKMVTRQ